MNDTNEQTNDYMQRWTVHVPNAHKVWRTVDRRVLDGFTTDGRLYLHCTLAEAQAVARQLAATRLQGNGWPVRTVGRDDDKREVADLQYRACDHCQCSGEYRWGPCINGAPPQFGGVCHQCQGKGYQDQDDQRRNYGYINHTIREAFHAR
jgi:hypothetical protein